MYVIGSDPDSEKHGIAVYRNGRLVELLNLYLVEIRQKIDSLDGPVVFGIENVLHTNVVYRRNAKESKAAHAKVALSVGRCQQAQVELMRELDYRGVKCHLFKPQAGNWAESENRPMFDRLTGWKGSSNKDNRSAAFFGFLALGRT